MRGSPFRHICSALAVRSLLLLLTTNVPGRGACLGPHVSCSSPSCRANDGTCGDWIRPAAQRQRARCVPPPVASPPTARPDVARVAPASGGGGQSLASARDSGRSAGQRCARQRCVRPACGRNGRPAAPAVGKLQPRRHLPRVRRPFDVRRQPDPCHIRAITTKPQWARACRIRRSRSGGLAERVRLRVVAKDTKRFTPRSPRTALEPETVTMPTRRSKSARNPFVVIGNAIISLFVLLAVVAGVALVIGKQRFDAPGPLGGGPHRQHPARFRHPRYRRRARPRGRDRSALGVHRRRVRAQGPRGSQGRRIPVQGARQRARRGRRPSSKARWCRISSPFRKA